MDTNFSTVDTIKRHLQQSTDLALDQNRYAIWRQDCPTFTNIDFLYSGLTRTISSVESGREFLQFSDEVLEKTIAHSTYFDALHSSTRLQLIKDVEEQSYKIYSELLASLGVDYLSEYPDLDGYHIEALDGHFSDHACHTPKNDEGKIFAAGTIYSINMRTGLMRPFCLVTNGTLKSHEAPVFRRYMEQAKEFTKSKQVKRISIYDKAMNNYKWWSDQSLQQHYMISLRKSNASIGEGTEIVFDKEHKVNTGVTSYAKHRKGTSSFNVIHYTDPETEIEHIFITTLPPSVNPGTIAMLYYKRWTIEKAFNNFKSDMKEKKAWSSSATALNIQSRFTTMAYNTMRVLEEKAQAARPELIHPSVKKYLKTLEEKQKIAEGKGRFVNPLHFGIRIARIKSHTFRSVRNAIIAATRYEDLMNRLIRKLVQPLPLAPER